MVNGSSIRPRVAHLIGFSTSRVPTNEVDQGLPLNMGWAVSNFIFDGSTVTWKAEVTFDRNTLGVRAGIFTMADPQLELVFRSTKDQMQDVSSFCVELNNMYGITVDLVYQWKKTRSHHAIWALRNFILRTFNSDVFDGRQWGFNALEKLLLHPERLLAHLMGIELVAVVQSGDLEPQAKKPPKPKRKAFVPRAAGRVVDVTALTDEARAEVRERLRGKLRDLKQQRVAALLRDLANDDRVEPQAGDMFGLEERVRRGIESGVTNSFAKIKEEMLGERSFAQIADETVRRATRAAIEQAKYPLLDTARAATSEATSQAIPLLEASFKRSADAFTDSFVEKIQAAFGNHPVVGFLSAAIGQAKQLAALLSRNKVLIASVVGVFVVVVAIHLAAKKLPPLLRSILPVVAQAAGFPEDASSTAQYGIDWCITAFLNGLMAFFGITQGGKASNTIISIATRSVPLKLYARGVVEGAMEWVQYCINFVREYFGYDKLKLFERRTTAVLAWLTESYQICADDKPPVSRLERERIVEHYRVGLRLKTTEVGRENSAEMERALAHLKAYKLDAEASLALERANREEPITVVLAGRPGIGKTTLIRQMVGPISAGVRPDIADAMRKDPHYNPDSHFYPKPSGEFHEGYEPWRHVIYGMDDIGTVKPGTGSVSLETDCMLFMRLVNIGVTPLNMAALDSKGTTFFNSPVILATTNMSRERLLSLANKEITNPDALDRRLHLWIEMKVRDKYLVQDPLAPAAVLGDNPFADPQAPTGQAGKLNMAKFKDLTLLERESVFYFDGVFMGQRIHFDNVGELISFIIREVKARQAVNTKLNDGAVDYALRYADIGDKPDVVGYDEVKYALRYANGDEASCSAGPSTSGPVVEAQSSLMDDMTVYEEVELDDGDSEMEHEDPSAVQELMELLTTLEKTGAAPRRMDYEELVSALSSDPLVFKMAALRPALLCKVWPEGECDIDWTCDLARTRYRILQYYAGIAGMDRVSLVDVAGDELSLGIFARARRMRKDFKLPAGIKRAWERAEQATLPIHSARSKFINWCVNAASAIGGALKGVAAGVGGFFTKTVPLWFAALREPPQEGTWWWLTSIVFLSGFSVVAAMAAFELVLRGLIALVDYMFGHKKRTHGLVPQSGDPGELVSKVNENSWFFHVHFEKGEPSLCGSVLFVQDNICLMPAHYLEHLDRARKLRGRIKYITLTRTTDAKEVKVEESILTRHSPNLLVMKDSAGRDQDMCLLRVPNMAPNTRITHRFRSKVQRRSYDLDILRFKGHDASYEQVESVCHAMYKQYSGPQGDFDYLLTEYVSYVCPTRKGDCGAVLFSCRETVPCIVGLHTAGSEAVNVGFSLSITREDLEAAVTRLCKTGGVLTVEAAVDTGPHAHIRAEAQMQAVGVSRLGGDVDRKGPSMVPSEAVGWHKPLTEFKVTKQPVDCSNKATLDSLAAYMKPNTLRLTDEEKDIVRAAARQMFYDHGVPKLNPTLITNVVAVQGRDGFEALMEPIPRSTSPGFPYRNLGAVKSKFIDIDGQINFDSPVWEMVCRDVDVVLDRARIGVGSVKENLIFQVSPKAELRSPGKGPRIIQGAPIVLTIAFRRLWWDMFRFYGAWSPEKEVAIGLDPHTDWGTLASWLSDNGQRTSYIAGDYKSFDVGQESDIKQCLFDAMVDCYPAFDSYNMARRILLNTADGAYVTFAGNVYKVPKGMPSGHPGTSLINGLYNCLLHRLAFARICYGVQNACLPARDCALTAFAAFRRHVRLSVTGDDNISTSTMPTFNERSLPSAMAAFGATYTMDLKDDKAVKDFRSLGEVSYLGRAFRRDPDRGGAMVAPLRMESILLMGQYAAKRSQLCHEWYRATVGSLLGELSYHDNDTWIRVGSVAWAAFAPLLGGRVKAPEERTRATAGVYPLEDDYFFCEEEIGLLGDLF